MQDRRSVTHGEQTLNRLFMMTHHSCDLMNNISNKSVIKLYISLVVTDRQTDSRHQYGGVTSEGEHAPSWGMCWWRIGRGLVRDVSCMMSPVDQCSITTAERSTSDPNTPHHTPHLVQFCLL